MSMQFPQADQYNQAIQNPQVSLSDPTLKSAKLEKNPLGLPAVRSGGFVSTYHLTLPDRREKALRCYQRQMPDLFNRYQTIMAAIKRPSVHDLFLNVEFQQQGILVNGQRYPVLVMDWVKGKPLNAWVESHLQQKSDLAQLAQQMEAILNRLAAQHMAHGDLQHGNILVDQQGQIRLIDYDSMFVPTLKGQKPYDRGHPNFQHPQRSPQEFDESLDRFPGIVILLALKALKNEPQLWQDFGLSGENLLFTQKDFREPDKSPLLKRLERLPECAPYIPQFRAYCKGRFDSVPSVATFFKTASPSKVAVAPASRPVEAWEAFPCFSALAPNASLITHKLEQITIVGQIQDIRYKTTKDNRPYAQIIFSNAFSFVALVFADGLDQFEAAGRNLEEFRYQWVRMTSNLIVFGKDPAYEPRPQFTVEYPSQIGIISQADAQQLIATGRNQASINTNSPKYDVIPGEPWPFDEQTDPFTPKPQKSPPQPQPKMPQPSIPPATLRSSPSLSGGRSAESQEAHDLGERLWGNKAVHHPPTPAPSKVHGVPPVQPPTPRRGIPQPPVMRQQPKPQQPPPWFTNAAQAQRPVPQSQQRGSAQKNSWLNRVINHVKRWFS